ncbi:glyoxalase [Streptomyces sp. AJS327]|uniref:VOC family protein n=1 Tax=Streptomyces sp. AJS327 TaxID=2545265 RepID=UPI0015DF256E|nr:VOC family protein [Streptomyces sp. AJS327]MBA0052700.1 glyoxalase [Streptomyces sp. AJS327]
MTHATSSPIWPVLHYDDTNAALRYLVDVLGLDEIIAVPDDEGDVVHAELGWSGGGALVLGSTKHTDSVHGGMRAGTSAVYLATDTVDAVDAVHARVREAGGHVAEPPHDATFGSGAASYTFTTSDPEGNLWTFGTYRGARETT